jgi:HD-like signal output (HDOD) protein
MLVVACSCGQKMKVPAEALGKTVTCVKCGERLRISLDTADPSEALPPGKRPAEAATAVVPPSPGSPAPRPESEALRLLRQHGLLSDRAVEEAAVLQLDFPRTQWDLLIDIGHLSPADFHTVMAKQKGIASIDLPNYHIPREVLDIVPADMAARGMFIPVDRLGKLLTLAMACPLDTDVIGDVERHTGLRVKRMLTTVEDIRRMLDACYPQHNRLMFLAECGGPAVYKEFEAILASSPVARRVAEIDHFAPFSWTAEGARVALDSDANGKTLRCIADLISLDPISTTMVLRVSNSEAYGFPSRVDGLGLACTLLGPAAVSRILSAEAAQDYRALRDGFDYEALWLRARFCAEAAQAVAMRINAQTAITAYTTALIHDLGRLALRQAAPNSYPRLTNGLTGAARIEVEERLFHLTAPEAGYLLARKWNLPPNLAEAIRYQRMPERAKNARELTTTVALAVLMADAFEMNASLNLDRAELFYVPLNLTRADTVDAFQEAHAAVAPAPAAV